MLPILDRKWNTIYIYGQVRLKAHLILWIIYKVSSIIVKITQCPLFVSWIVFSMCFIMFIWFSLQPSNKSMFRFHKPYFKIILRFVLNQISVSSALIILVLKWNLLCIIYFQNVKLLSKRRVFNTTIVPKNKKNL